MSYLVQLSLKLGQGWLIKYHKNAWLWLLIRVMIHVCMYAWETGTCAILKCQNMISEGLPFSIPITVTSNHRSLDCLSNRMFMRRQKKTSKLRVTDLWEGNPQVTGRFPPQKASNTEDVSIWWCHHAKCAFRLSSKINISRIVFLSLCVFILGTQPRMNG